MMREDRIETLEDAGEDRWDDPFYEEDLSDGFGCVLGKECIVADPIHLSSECHTARDAERYHRNEWLRSEVLEHGAGPEAALVLEKALVAVLASATVANERVMGADDPAPYRHLLFERWPGIAREALAHEAPALLSAGEEEDADADLLDRLMDLREALHSAERYERYASGMPDHEVFHGVCVEVPDFVKRALEGRPEYGCAAEDASGSEPAHDGFSDLPF
jgi:hypothetical protein